MTIARQVFALLTAGGYLAASVRLPLPAGPLAADAAFPCQYHGCGCVDARMCRTKCCCIKPAKPVVRCCTKKSATAGCPRPEVVAAKAPVAETSKNPEVRSTKRPEKPSGWILGSLACRGATPTFAGVGPVAPIEPECVTFFAVTPHRAVFHAVSAMVPQHDLHPLVPPPRTIL